MSVGATGNLSLIAPQRRFERSYRNLIEEITTLGERFVPFTLSFEYENFDELIDRLSANSKGLGIPDGFVANSSFWLVRDDSEIVGVSNVRHDLTPALRLEGGHIGYGIRPSLRRKGFGVQILRHTLTRARSLGLTRVLLTCGKSNLASAKAIIANGGVLESEAYYPPRSEVLQRYWIELDATAT